MSESEITARKAVAHMPLIIEAPDDYAGMREAMGAYFDRVMNGPPLTAVERLRQRGRYLIEMARRDSERCRECGCHPDEHGECG